MSTENVTRFIELASTDATIQAKLQQIYGDSARSAAEKVAALSTETGAPFTAEEFLAAASSSRQELSEADLEAVAGGAWDPGMGNIMFSLASLGVGCAVYALLSAGKGNVDACQPQNN